MERIAREVCGVTDGLIRLAEAGREGTGETSARPTALSLSVGGRKVLRVRAGEMHLRFGTFIGPGASRKGSDRRRTVRVIFLWSIKLRAPVAIRATGALFFGNATSPSSFPSSIPNPIEIPNQEKNQHER